MTAQEDPYVRVYYRIIDDPKFASVYDDDQALATWLRLLLHADAMYPAAAILPHGTKRAALDKLVKAGLVDLGTGHRYRIHGLAAEREKRAEAARFAADVKHHGTAEAVRRQSERIAAAQRAQSDGSADGVPLLADPLRSDPNHSTPSRADAPARVRLGSKEPDEKNERIARAMSVLNDPEASTARKEVARGELARLS